MIRQVFELASSLVLSNCRTGAMKEERSLLMVIVNVSPKLRSDNELSSVKSPVCFIPIVQQVDHGLKTLLDTTFLSKKIGEKRQHQTERTIPRTSTTRSLCMKLWIFFQSESEAYHLGDMVLSEFIALT